jgi:hypothetical protein
MAARKRLFLIFPVTLFTGRDPVDSSFDALVARFLALGIDDPLDIFAFAAGAEVLKGLPGFLVLVKCFAELGRGFERGLGRLDDFVAGRDGTRVLTAIDEGCGLADPGEEIVLRREIGDAGDAAERAHGAIAHDSRFAEDGADFQAPEAEAAVLLECRHVAEDDVLVSEEGATPFDGFFDFGAGRVNDFAQVDEDGLCEGLGFLYICVDFGVVRGSGHVEGLRESGETECTTTGGKSCKGSCYPTLKFSDVRRTLGWDALGFVLRNASKFERAEHAQFGILSI